MKLSRLFAACVVALGLCHAGAQASSASSSASIYDITFQLASGGAPTFGTPGGEATTVQYSLTDSDGNTYFDFASNPNLFAQLSVPLTFTNTLGTISASASAGDAPLGFFMTASGSTNMPLGSYAAAASLNQDYQGSSTQGGWLTLAANTTLTIAGRYSMAAALGGTLCDTTSFCSSATAEVFFGLGDDRREDTLQLSGDSGRRSDADSGTFSFSLSNFESIARDVFFYFGVAAQGVAANVLENGGGGGDGGPGGPGGGGGTGNVPEPATAALLALALCGLAWSRRQQRAQLAVARPSLAA